MSHSKALIADPDAMYREMQRAIPGLDDMYRLVHALIADHDKAAPQVLVVGAGGGREIAELRNGDVVCKITAVDPSARNLQTARTVTVTPGTSPEVRFVTGTVDDLPDGESFDVVTSLLVMQHLPDDGSKLAYLKARRNRLAPGGQLIHADVCVDEPGAFDQLVGAFHGHAVLHGISEHAMRLELGAIDGLPVVSASRTGNLFAEAGLTEPFEVFRSLWYRCWISTCAAPF